ncbi:MULTISPECIES: succinate dehydrogenase, hydrophobic membrane anchor protein [Pacificibacter]|uniref:succinate dehydrogenase, hydrophobic membrane anchor protein n=1 Tax=Pacificibacter TaxID=1042323 RepID=UPI001C0883AF|nr:MULTISPECIES: succinate dehydrogenase, hydrophobic membrane anchor protein [Pacificibacter]MBU2937701.1 succinate dehydrogenase, hydrophobic membrane anchor protein [Pacificibacter marinus]MDO6616195.1 succinate dehydrogenase, hydrophobic membrane anchor protein [Pacificibacter sp. 1_MG-2023]
MSFITDRKRAVGLGAGGHGADHHWQRMVASICLAILVPLFVFTFGCALGGTYGDVTTYYSRPFPAIVAGLTLIVGIPHLMREANVAVEDYVGGTKRQLTMIAVSAFSYTLLATGLFALVKLAL